MITARKIKAVAIGHAVADALGVPVEFRSRETLDENPVTEMLGFGTHRVPKGAWSDDTSMALASLDSLARGVFDFDDVMRKFGEWYFEDKYTPTGEVFDAGGTCIYAIHRYNNKNISIDECGSSGEGTNGNGSLMRIYPFVVVCALADLSEKLWEPIIEKASALTHAHERSKLGCKIYARILMSLLFDPSETSLKNALTAASEKYATSLEYCHYQRIFSPDFKKLTRETIKSTGYVVDTLEAALWCLMTTNDYKSCVLKAANLGDDTDTVAAVAGSLAGALYGYDGIPDEWRNALLKRDYIEELCLSVYNAWSKK